MTTRTLRLGALTSATAVLLGLATLTGAGPAAADPALPVSGVLQYDDIFGTRHIYGVITNNTGAPTAVQADLMLYAADNSVVGSAVGTPLVAVLAPGESAPFEAQPLDVYDHFDVSASPAASVTPLNHAFGLTKGKDYTDGAGARHIQGSVKNLNTTPADNVTVVFTFFRTDGAVVGADQVGVGAGGPLGPDATATFDMPVNDAFPTYDTWTAMAQSDSAPSGDGTGTGPITGSDDEPTVTLNCNPTMRLSTKTVNVGNTTTVSVSGGTPGSKLTLEGYSRPSTTYAPIRSEVTVGPDGSVAPFAVRPPTSARVRLRIAGCTNTGTEQVISVIPGLSITVTRVGVRTYTFSGKIIPGKQNTGRAIALYLGSTPVKKVTVKSAADGTYKATLTLPRGATKAYWATGANMTNLAGKSAVKAFTPV
jgi:hypothetical protein